MSSASTENHSLSREIFKSTVRIIRSHSLHFYALSILFLFPIFLTLVVYPSFHLALFHPDYSFTSSIQLQFSHVFPISSLEIIVSIVYALFVVLFFLCAVATTTYSTVQAYHDRPINLVSSIKSIRNSFFPLLSTFIVSHTIFISIILIFAILLVFLVQILQSLGLSELKYDLNHFSTPVILVIVPVLIWLQVNWSLANTIAAVESNCGFEALRRSAYLVKGMRWVAFWTHLFYVLAMGGMVIGTNVLFVLLGAMKGDNWRSFSVISQTVQCTVLGTLGMNQFLVLNVVLYMYCMELKGEKSPFEYVSMPLVDAEKTNHAIV